MIEFINEDECTDHLCVNDSGVIQCKDCLAFFSEWKVVRAYLRSTECCEDHVNEKIKRLKYIKRKVINERVSIRDGVRYNWDRTHPWKHGKRQVLSRRFYE